jgi:hypothetical protein
VLRGSVGVVVALSLVAMALSDFVDVEDPERMPPQMSFVQHALGQSTREEFVARIGRGVLEPIVWMNKNLPKDAKVLYVGEARAYYAKHPVVWSTAFDQHPLTALSREAKSPEELLSALRTDGITHVYVNSAELKRLRNGYDSMMDANWELIQTAWQRATEIHRQGPGVVYELRE